ncbi:MAG: tripartite tricarboxylate transporter permease [Candidatus Micrarchaeota archaeon]
MEDLNPLVFLAGWILGIVSGIFPGLHSNTIISILDSMNIEPQQLALMIIALYPTHLIISIIPSIFFGIPEEGTVLLVLPGHRMVLQGNGIGALKIVLASSIVAALIAVSIFFISGDIYKLTYGILKQYFPHIVALFSIILILKSKRPYFALPIFICAGMLGYSALRSDMPDPFLPLFSGMFAAAAILTYRKCPVPKQTDSEIKPNFLKYTAIGVAAGMFADLLPGISSPSQVATFMSILVPLNTLGYMAAVSAIGMSEAIFSLSTAASIGKARIGATVWLSKLVDINSEIVPLLILFLISISMSASLVFLLRKKIAKLAELDFSKANIILLVYLVVISFLIDSWLGLAVFLIGAGLGWITIKMGVERTMLMGAVIVPVLLIYFRM